MTALITKKSFRGSTSPNASPVSKARILNSRCIVNGALWSLAILLIISAFLMTGRLDRVHAELDTTQAFEAARAETIVKLFEFGTLQQNLAAGTATPDHRAVLSAFNDYLASLKKLSNLRLFEGQEAYLSRIHDLSTQNRRQLDLALAADAGSNGSGVPGGLDIDPLVSIFTELGTYTASLIADRVALQADTYRMNTILIVAAGALISAIAVMTLLCLRKRMTTIKNEQEELLAHNKSLNAEITRKVADLNRVETLFVASLGASGVIMFMQDRDLVYSWIHGAIPGLLTDHDIGRSDYERASCPDQETMIAAKRDVLATGKSLSFEFDRQMPGRDVAYWINIDPLLQDGKIIGVVGVLKDISERRRREEDTRALLQELVHRAQNLLGVVLSMAKLSARSSGTIDEFGENFSGRIASMARSFEVLVDHDWHGAPIRMLLTTSLASLDPRVQNRFMMSGDDCHLNPLLAQNIAMAFHELLGNAMRHGSLSDGQGRVAISWSTAPRDDGASEFNFRWTEISAEPKLLRPELVGFGRTVLETIVPKALNGVATLSNGPQGIVWTLSCPFDAYTDASSSLSMPMSAALTVLEEPQAGSQTQMYKSAVGHMH